MNFIPRPINTALGKNECVKTFRRDVLCPFNVEAREIQDAVFSREWHERDVVAIARDKRHRQFFALRFFNGGESAMTICGRLGRLDRHAVLAQNFHGRAVDRLTTFDRHQKNIAAAVGVFLRQNSDVGNKQKSAVPGRPDRFLFRWVPAARSQEKQAALAPAICRFAKVLREIERRVIGLPFVFHRDRLLLNRDPRDVFLVKIQRRAELRVLELAFGLANEMVDLGCGNARNFEFDRPQSA